MGVAADLERGTNGGEIRSLKEEGKTTAFTDRLLQVAEVSGSIMMSLMNKVLPESENKDHRPNGCQSLDEDLFKKEPPLLEELGINLQHIRIKALAAILPNV